MEPNLKQDEIISETSNKKPNESISYVQFILLIIIMIGLAYTPIGLVALYMFSTYISIIGDLLSGKVSYSDFLKLLPALIFLPIAFLWLYFSAKYKSKLIFWSLPLLYFIYSVFSALFKS